MLDEQDEGEELIPPALSNLAVVCLALELIQECDLVPHAIAATIDRLDLTAAFGLTVVCRLAKKSMIITEHGITRKVPYITPLLETLRLDS
jgi:hypothetical protein